MADRLRGDYQPPEAAQPDGPLIDARLEGTTVWVGYSVFTQNLRRIRPLQQARVARAAARAARKVAQSWAEVEVMARG
jgi:hypothetical protein